ncbi:MAG TPA: cation:dicarboxylase symporter family transporter [Thermoanaerobaculia bacterium]|nr:cation:dicarboxylase symporter family transporter [Thermoanaerobaculia bacterium]
MSRPRWLSSTALIFYALLLGVLLGYLLPAERHPAAYETFRFLSRAFISLIKMLIVPLIFSTIIVGIGKTGDVKAVGRMGLKAIIYFEIATTAALVLGLTIAHLVRPGQGLTLPPSGEQLAKPKTLVETLLHLFPSNVVDAMAKQDILQVVIFATLVGIAAAHVGRKAEPFLKFFDSAVAVMFQLTDYVMALTPLGVFGAMAGSVSHHGLSVLASYARLVASLYGALVLFTLLVLIPALLIVRANLRLFFRKIREPFLLAFSTASSEAALPRALEKMVEFGVPESVAGFVIPAGYSFNLDGSTLYISLATLTIAQAAHVDLPLSTELLMMLTFLMTSKGVAGVPRAALVVIAAGCAAFNLPGEAGVAMILAVDELMDMARTSINVMGNCVASVVVARWEGVLGKSVTVKDEDAPGTELAQEAVP